MALMEGERGYYIATHHQNLSTRGVTVAVMVEDTSQQDKERRE
jgi:hypothetical protein